MAYPSAPEFQTSDNGYSPDKFYVSSKIAQDGERRWVSLGRVSLPAEFLATVEDLIHSRRYHAYRSVADVVRDCLVHGVFRRLSELEDGTWAERRDEFSVLFDLERLEMKGQMVREAVERWTKLLNDERDSRVRKDLLRQAREHLEILPDGYWRDQLEALLDRSKP